MSKSMFTSPQAYFPPSSAASAVPRDLNSFGYGARKSLKLQLRQQGR